MQNQQYYKSTAGSNKYAWVPYPDYYAIPYICEKPQSLYACSNLEPPPALPLPSCTPYDNDTGAMFAQMLAEGSTAQDGAEQPVAARPLPHSVLPRQPDKLLLVLLDGGALRQRHRQVHGAGRLPGQLRRRSGAAASGELL